MARVLNDGNTKVTIVPAIADIHAPKAATELGVATCVDLQGILTPDGFDIGNSEASIDASVLSSVAEYEEPGRYKLTTKLIAQRDDVVLNDVAWTVAVRGTRAFLVVRRDKPEAEPYAAADKLEVYTITFGKRLNAKPTKNTVGTFTVTLFHSGADVDDAVAVA